MERKFGFGFYLANKAGLPPESVSGQPRLTLDGCGEALVENHRGILEYGGELIEIDGGRVRVRLRGEGLELKFLCSGEMVIGGQIFTVEFI